MLFFSFFLVSSCQNERIDLANAAAEQIKTANGRQPLFNEEVEKNYNATAKSD
jgi:hypothetical protein